MDQLIEFANNHMLLVSAFFLIMAALIWNLISNPDGKFNVDPADATRMINHDDALILDVRSMAEFKGGHIINAENAPLNSLKNHFKKLEKYKQKPIIAVCQSGTRSGSACSTLRKEGFEQLYTLKGGMMAWEDAKLPVKRGK